MAVLVHETVPQHMQDIAKNKVPSQHLLFGVFG
jgi:hypothetical protein